jgi:hypothetical protein
VFDLPAQSALPAVDYRLGTLLCEQLDVGLGA